MDAHRTRRGPQPRADQPRARHRMLTKATTTLTLTTPCVRIAVAFFRTLGLTGRGIYHEEDNVTKNLCWVCTSVLMVLIAAPFPTLAQTGSGLAGTVRDTSGAVLPGVTVEANSPALIEKVRVVVTDSEGRFSITELNPGRYTVTFSLPGFTTVKREGIVLVTGFTGNVNADL